MISENLSSLNGKSVKDYDVKTGIQNPDTVIYRLRVDYDSSNSGQNIPDMLKQFCSDRNASKVEELIIGAFDFDGGDTKQIVDVLAESSSRLPQLKVLFIGDITYEENEISWINQCDVSPILKAYPTLEYFRVRGGNSLSLGKPLQHSNLKYLIIESGGLPPNVIAEVNNSNLPNLEYLELWLGSNNYGFESSVSDFAPILAGTNFPRLRYLGLRDSEITDELAVALDNAPVLQKLEMLDLSMGTLSDVGAKALLKNSALKRLKMLDLHHHYISDEVSKQLKQLGITVNLDDKKEEEDGDRYIEVSE
jgi:hypothetical protein